MPDEVSFFYARLCCKAKLVMDVNTKPYPILSLLLGDKTLKLSSYKQIQGWVLKHPELLNEESRLVLFPKTNRECVLTEKTHLHLIVPEDQSEAFEEGFKALGELVFVNREEASFGVRIHPNLKSKLKQSFMLRLMASLDTLDQLPVVGAAVKTKGELKAKSLRLLATEVQAVDLPAIKRA